jgi:iron-sulfur cluster repair protein YtfE (RIC family)
MMTADLNLDTRAGWPDELRFYLERYPRPVWPGHANLGELSRFWLQIHDGFRSLGGALKAKTTDFREGRVAAEEYRRWLGPQLQTLLSHLHGHHQIEDYQFFPLFSAAEPRLVQGFEVLERDHEHIHATIERIVETANTLLRAPASDLDLIRRSADAYADNGDALLRQLDRHLADEEDLIIPLILDRSEAKLGI